MAKINVKTLGLCILSLQLGITHADQSQTADTPFYKMSDYTYVSHHGGSIPLSFVGKYIKSGKKLQSTMSIDADGHVQGTFKRATHVIQWTGSVSAVGTAPSGQKRLEIHYLVSRENFGKVAKNLKNSIDTPGKIFLDAPQKGLAMMDTIGDYANYISLNQEYHFQKNDR